MLRKVLLSFIAVGFLILLFAFVKDKESNKDFETDKEIIVMRKMAHDILQYAGDSTSLILPVEKLSETEFRIPFQSSFSFVPDSFVNIINKVIAENHLPSTYIVKVLECNTGEIIFGYAFLGAKEKNIVPCQGRDQPNMRYCINIKFEERNIYTSNNLYKAGISLLFVALLLFGVQRLRRSKDITEVLEIKKVDVTSKAIHVGRFVFYADEQVLKINEEKIVLTIKEAKILSIFALHPNQIVDRNKLQKEVWEDEGVIVGRSLDMFISKLRKKLEQDPNVKLVNIHGKGYRLEIGVENM